MSGASEDGRNQQHEKDDEYVRAYIDGVLNPKGKSEKEPEESNWFAPAPQVTADETPLTVAEFLSRGSSINKPKEKEKTT